MSKALSLWQRRLDGGGVESLSFSSLIHHTWVQCILLFAVVALLLLAFRPPIVTKTTEVDAFNDDSIEVTRLFVWSGIFVVIYLLIHNSKSKVTPDGNSDDKVSSSAVTSYHI